MWNGAAPWVGLACAVQGQGMVALGVLASAHWPWLWATLVPGSRLWGEVTTGVAEGVWITIDDGPDPVDTPVLLDQLEAAGARATFFFIGRKVAAHPDLVREVLRRGHAVGNHTMTHPAGVFWALTRRQIAREVEGCAAAMREVAAEWRGEWFRAPAGLRNHWLHPVLEGGGLRLAGWSVRGYDGVAADPESVLRRLRAGLRPGAVLLMHEGRLAADGSRLAPQVLAGVLATMRERGLRSVLG